MRLTLYSLSFSAAVAVALACSGAACAQPRPAGFPNKPIRLIVPFAAGGGTDVVARTMSPHLAERLGQPVLVENRTGAGGNIGTDFVAKSPADGYVVAISTTGPLAVNPTLYAKLPYDPLKDLAPVTLVGFTPIVLVANGASQISSVPDLLAQAKAKPGGVSYGSAGTGTVQHLSGQLLTLVTGVPLTHVPYKGDGASVIDLVAGQIPVAFSALLPALPHIRAGRLKALGVTMSKRTEMAPDIPTITEAGVPEFDSTGWWGAVAPGGTAPDVLARLNAAMVETLKLTDVRERMFNAGAEPAPGTPEQFGAFLKSEITKWTRVVKATGARVD